MSTIPVAISAPVPTAEAVAEKHTFRRLVTWKSAFIVSLGGSILVAVSLGQIASDLGPASVFVWSFVAFLGVLQCLMIGEMAGMFPDKSGGTPVYTHEAFKKVSPIFGVISNWGYWLGWIPVVPVNLILIGGYMKAALLPHGSTVAIAITLGILLCVVNYFGLKPGIWSSVVMAACSLGPLAVIAFSPVFRHSLFHAAFVTPFIPLNGSWHSHASWMLIFKDMFLALWSAYAFEAASTVVAELLDPKRDAAKAMISASVVGVFAYGVVPYVLLAIVGVSVISGDPSTAFLPAATAIFGKAGGIVVSLMLITALLLGAQTAIIGTSRALYEMSRDGMMIRQFGHLNKYRVPDRCIIWDAIVTVALLAVFKDNIPSMVAASNVGYLLVFMLLIPGYIIMRYTMPNMARPFKLANFFIPIAVVVTLINWFLFFVGGFQWGFKTIMTGVVIMLAVIPFYFWRTKMQDGPGGVTLAYAPGQGLPEDPEYSDDMGGRREVVHSDRKEAAKQAE